NRHVPLGDAHYQPQVALHDLVLHGLCLFEQALDLVDVAGQLRQQLDPPTASAGDIDQIQSVLEPGQAVQNPNGQSKLRLGVRNAKRHVSASHEFFELVSDGNVSLMRAVDKFDFNRGFKFSTYASWAIMKNFARTVPEERQLRDRYQTGRDEYLENAVGVRSHEHDSDELP